MLLKAKDTLWKGIIEDLFADFLRFFYPQANKIFDMDKGFEFLDKELEQLYPGKDIMHPKFVDKLVKVYKRNGAEEWVLIHIEVQGYNDKTFARRMFTYFCRIFDRFNKEMASIAIFTGNDRNYHPDRFEYKFLNTSNTFRFDTYKIQGKDITELQNSDNPFAIIVLTVLIALQKGKQEDMFRLSVDLVKRLLKKGFSREKIDQLLTFLKAYVNFEDQKTFLKFEEEIDELTNKKRTMGIKELVLHLVKEEGIEEGLEKGAEKTQTTIIANLLQKTNHSLQEIADLAAVSIDFVIGVKNGLPGTAH